MSIALMSAVMANGPANSSERFVLLALANYADAEGKCWPAYATIAERTALSRRTVIRCVESLIEHGYLRRRSRQRDDGESLSNYYWIDFGKLNAARELVDEGSDTMSLGSDMVSLPSDTVTPRGSDTMTLGSDTVSPDPSMIRHSSEPSGKQQQKQQTPRSRSVNEKRKNAAAAAAYDKNSDAVEAVLKEYGVAVNWTTLPLLNLKPDYVRGHLAAADRNGEKPGLAIRRMLDGDKLPKLPGEETVKQYIPPELADVVMR